MRKIKYLGVIALIAIFSFSLSTCDNGSNPTIEQNQTPNVNDFEIGNLTQIVGNVSAVTITPKAGKSTGAITTFYNGSTTLPSTVGTFPVTFNVAAATGWNAVSGLFAGTLTVNSINPDNQTPIASDYTFGNLNQVAGSVTAVTITVNSGKSPGTISNIRYNGSTTIPQTSGTYPVTFDVLAATGWNAAIGLSAGNLVVGNPANQTPVASDYTFGNLNQTAGSVIAVTITANIGKSSGTVSNIRYNGSTTIPQIAGTYSITFDVAAATGWNAVTGLSGGNLIVSNQTPVVSDFVISGLNQTYNGSPKTVTIAPLSGKSIGVRTIYYNGSTTAPTAVGTYNVTFNVAATTGWNAAVGLVAGTLSIIAPGEATFSIGFEQIIDEAPVIASGIILYLYSNGGPTTETLVVTNPEDYSSIGWRVKDTNVTGIGASFTLNANNSAYNFIGEHFLTVVVFKGIVPYNKTISFLVRY